MGILAILFTYNTKGILVLVLFLFYFGSDKEHQDVHNKSSHGIFDCAIFLYHSKSNIFIWWLMLVITITITNQIFPNISLTKNHKNGSSIAMSE